MAAAGIGTGVFLWWAMDDYTRARYYPLLIGGPHSAMAVAGILGYAPELKRGKLKLVKHKLKA